MVRGFLALVGLSAFGIFLWWKHRRDRQAAAAQEGAGQDAAGAAPAGGADEIDALLREAEARLAGSNQGKLGNLPVILVAGPPASAKTNTMVHSGLEPELIAGQVYQDTAIVSTRSANVWFARQTVFVDAGGRLIQDPGRWMRLVKRLEPRKLVSALGKGQQAPRAAALAALRVTTDRSCMSDAFGFSLTVSGPGGATYSDNATAGCAGSAAAGPFIDANGLASLDSLVQTLVR